MSLKEKNKCKTCLMLNAGNTFLNPLEFKHFLWGGGGVPNAAYSIKFYNVHKGTLNLLM